MGHILQDELHIFIESIGLRVAEQTKCYIKTLLFFSNTLFWNCSYIVLQSVENIYNFLILIGRRLRFYQPDSAVCYAAYAYVRDTTLSQPRFLSAYKAEFVLLDVYYRGCPEFYIRMLLCGRNVSAYDI